MATPSRPYFSNGQMLERPPLSARLSRLADSAYNFVGLYVVSFFSLDPYTAAQNSQFNVRGNPNSYTTRPRWGGGGGGGGGGGSGGSGGSGSDKKGPGGAGGSFGAGGRRIGRIDDVRAPECGSCR